MNTHDQKTLPFRFDAGDHVLFKRLYPAIILEVGEGEYRLQLGASQLWASARDIEILYD